MKDQFKSKRKNGKVTTIVIVVFFLFPAFYFFSNFFTEIFTSGTKIKNSISIHLKDKENLILENEDLKEKIKIYENPSNLFYFYTQENDRLRKEIGYKNFSQLERKIFPILSRESNNIYGTFIIDDAGNEVGVGDLVFHKFNILIGYVVERSSGIAKIQLFSQAGAINNFHLSDGGVVKMEIEGVGQGGGVIKVSAPRDIDFKNSGKVFLVNKNNNSYLVAELVEQKFKTQDTNKILYFKILANTNLLSQVKIQKVSNKKFFEPII